MKKSLLLALTFVLTTGYSFASCPNISFSNLNCNSITDGEYKMSSFSINDSGMKIEVQGHKIDSPIPFEEEESGVVKNIYCKDNKVIEEYSIVGTDQKQAVNWSFNSSGFSRDGFEPVLDCTQSETNDCDSEDAKYTIFLEPIKDTCTTN